MDERQEEMNNQEFETFKKMLVLHLEELKGLESDPEAWKPSENHHRDLEGLKEKGGLDKTRPRRSKTIVSRDGIIEKPIPVGMCNPASAGFSFAVTEAAQSVS